MERFPSGVNFCSWRSQDDSLVLSFGRNDKWWLRVRHRVCPRVGGMAVLDSELKIDIAV